MIKPTPLQTARRENEMRRIILNHRKLTYRDYIQSPEAMQRLLAGGTIKSMPKAQYADLGEEYDRRRRQGYHAKERNKGVQCPTK